MIFVFKGETTTTSIAPETSTEMTTNATIVTSTEADATTDDAMSSSTTTELSNPTEAETTSGKTFLIFKNNYFKSGKWLSRY